MLKSTTRPEDTAAPAGTTFREHSCSRAPPARETPPPHEHHLPGTTRAQEHHPPGRHRRPTNTTLREHSCSGASPARKTALPPRAPPSRNNSCSGVSPARKTPPPPRAPPSGNNSCPGAPPARKTPPPPAGAILRADLRPGASLAPGAVRAGTGRCGRLHPDDRRHRNSDPPETRSEDGARQIDNKPCRIAKRVA